MGYGIILGSGGVNLNYKAVYASTYAGLPSGQPANTLGFITSTAIGKVIFNNGTVTGMVAGDVVVRQVVTSSYPFNVLPNGQLYINAGTAYQWNGSAWVRIDMYVYSGTAWNFISSIYYDYGTIPPSTGDFLRYANSGTITLTKNADNLQLDIVSGTGWCYGRDPVDLTHVNTLKFRVKLDTSSIAAWVGCIGAYNSSAGAVHSLITGVGSYTDISVNVSAVTGNKYIYFGRDSTDGDTTRTINVQKIWGE